MDLIIADPPYNVYEDDVIKMPFQQRKKHVEWDQYDKNFIDFSLSWIESSIAKLKETGSLFIFGGVNYKKGNDLLTLIQILREELEFINIIVWHYPNGFGARRFFSNRFELIAWFAKSRKYHFYLDAVRIKYDEDTLQQYLKDKRLNPENVRKGKNPTNVWEIGRINANAKERLEHPTQKPEEIMERIILSTTKEEGLVVDPFVGSGTTAKVCQDLNRNFIGFEKKEQYLKMAQNRLNLQDNVSIVLKDKGN